MSYGIPVGNHYLREAVQTASPSARLLMLYDRLLGDLTAGQAAIEAEPTNYEEANDRLQHAQQILLGLEVTVDVTKWAAGEKLRALYAWMRGQLLEANLRKDPKPVSDCREIAGRLRDTWREAALRALEEGQRSVVNVV